MHPHSDRRRGCQGTPGGWRLPQGLFRAWQGWAWEPGPVLPPQPGAGQSGGSGGSPSPRESSTSLGHVPGLDVSPWVGPAGQGSGKLETSPVAVSLRRDRWPQGADMGSWDMGRVGEPWGRLVRDSHAWQCPQGPDIGCSSSFLEHSDQTQGPLCGTWLAC